MSVRPRDSYRCCRSIAVSNVAIAGDKVVLTLAREVAGDEVVGLSYWLSEARGGSGIPLKESRGQRALGRGASTPWTTAPLRP